MRVKTGESHEQVGSKRDEVGRILIVGLEAIRGFGVATHDHGLVDAIFPKLIGDFFDALRLSHEQIKVDAVRKQTLTEDRAVGQAFQGSLDMRTEPEIDDLHIDHSSYCIAMLFRCANKSSSSSISPSSYSRPMNVYFDEP